jgi:acyl-CoA-binding protein
VSGRAHDRKCEHDSDHRRRGFWVTADELGADVWGDLQGKAKHNKWAEVKDLSAADAQKKYVAAVKKLVAEYK